MYEEYSRTLSETELQQYLNRIGIAEKKEPTLSFLDELILAHQLTVPFETLDSSLFHKNPDIDTDTLFQKIVVNRRGGYCFELNSLFTRLLLALGFDAYSCFAKVVRGKDMSAPILLLHRLNMIRLSDGLYLCDVGYGGPMPACAIPVRDGASRTCLGETFRSVKSCDPWWFLARTTSTGEAENVLMYYPMPQSDADFIPMNLFASEDPRSIFTQKVMANLRTIRGNISLTDFELTIRSGNLVEMQCIASSSERDEVLKKYFSIATNCG